MKRGDLVKILSFENIWTKGSNYWVKDRVANFKIGDFSIISNIDHALLFNTTNITEYIYLRDDGRAFVRDNLKLASQQDILNWKYRR